MDSIDAALLLVRVWLGVVMIAHGLNHLRTQEGTARWFASKGFRSPELNARMSAFNELAIGAGLLLGLLTSVAAAGLVATMLVAFWSIHRFAGFFVFHRPDEGYEYVVTLAVTATALAIIGPGSISIDEILGRDDVLGMDLSGAMGAGIIGLGLLAGAGLLAAFWRKPSGDTSPA
jgi:putative oxidoreductase